MNVGEEVRWTVRKKGGSLRDIENFSSVGRDPCRWETEREDEIRGKRKRAGMEESRVRRTNRIPPVSCRRKRSIDEISRVFELFVIQRRETSTP